jgi:acyl-CoA thioesterase FadM
MVKRLRTLSGGAGSWLLLAPLALCTVQAVQAQGSTTLVTIDLGALKPIPVPEDLRRRIAKIEQW